MNRIAQILIIVFSGFSFFSIENPEQGATAVATPLILSFLSIFIFWMNNRRSNQIEKTSIKILVFFLFSFIITNFQAYIDLILGFLEIDNRFIWKGWKSVGRSAFLSTAALAAFLLGYDLHSKYLKISRKKLQYQRSGETIIGIVYFIALLGYLVFIDKSYLFGGYGSSEQGFWGGIFALVFESSLVAILSANAFKYMGKMKMNLIAYFFKFRFILLLLLVYLVTVMLSGDRGPLIYLSLCVILHFTLVSGKKIDPKILLVGAVVGLLFMTFLGQVRNAEGDFLDKISSNTKNFYDIYPDSFSKGTKELAGSVRVNHVALNNFPKNFPHTYGLLTLQEILLIIPGVKGMFIDFFGIPKFLTSSAQFITFISLGPNATSGEGTTCVADVYINFGPFGVVIVFALFGFLMKKLDNIIDWKVASSVYMVVLLFLFFSYAIYIPRGTILYPLSKSFVVCVIVFIGQIKWFESKQRLA